MITTLLHLLRLFPFLCGGHRQLTLENLALRQQLTVYRRTVARPRLRRGDRLFWVALSRLWRGWKQALVIVACPSPKPRPDEPAVDPSALREWWDRLEPRPPRPPTPAPTEMRRPCPGPGTPLASAG
jgi:hypothetical protein